MMFTTAKAINHGAYCLAMVGKNDTQIRIIPYPPIFNNAPARTTLTAVGASVWASVTMYVAEKTGSLTANPPSSRKKINVAGTAGQHADSVFHNIDHTEAAGREI